MLLSRRKFAKHVGLSHTRINKLVRVGVIPLHEGKIKLEEGKRAMKENEDPSRDAQREANAKRRKSVGVFAEENLPKHSVADMTEEEKAEYDKQLADEHEKLKKAREDARLAGVAVISNDTEIGEMTLTEAKLFREFYMGKKAELEYKIAHEELVYKSDVEKKYYEIGRVIRDSLFNLSHKLSVRIVGKDNVKEIETILDESIHEVLEGLQ